MGWVVSATPRPLYTRERPGIHCIGGWVGPRVGLDGCGKISPPTGFDPQTVNPVASRYTDCAIRAHNFCPHNIFRYNETGLAVVMHKEWDVISLEGERTGLSFFSTEG